MNVMCEETNPSLRYWALVVDKRRFGYAMDVYPEEAAIYRKELGRSTRNAASSAPPRKHWRVLGLN
jgi:hypothetical protein